MVQLAGNHHAPGSARRDDATLTLYADGSLELRVGDAVHRYTKDQVHISSGLGDLPRDFRFADGRKFDCPDDPRIGAWLEGQGLNRGARFVRSLERRWRWVAISVVTVAVTIVVMLVWGIPASAGWLSGLVPTRARVEVGNQGFRIIEKLLGDELEWWEIPIDLPSVFERIAEPYQEEDFQITLSFYEAGTIGPNAFAVPNGRVIMTDSFIELADADSVALIGVLAHEIGHLHHRHGMQRAIQSSSLPVLVALVTGDLGSGAALLGTVPMTLIESGYGREHEREADAFARDLMRAHGYSTQPVADLFERLRKELGDVPGWLSTHPGHEERAAFFSDPAS